MKRRGHRECCVPGTRAGRTGTGRPWSFSRFSGVAAGPERAQPWLLAGPVRRGGRWPAAAEAVRGCGVGNLSLPCGASQQALLSVPPLCSWRVLWELGVFL